MPGATFAATAIVPSGFIVIPAAGLAPGVSVALPPAPSATATPLVVSLPTTDGVVPPVPAGKLCGGPKSSTASMLAATGVTTVLEQRAAPGQVGSPPPETEAVLVKLVPPAFADAAVTGITKLVLLPAARPAAMVHVTV